MTMVIVSPLSRVVPLPNDLNGYTYDTWDDPPSTTGSRKNEVDNVTTRVSWKLDEVSN